MTPDRRSQTESPQLDSPLQSAEILWQLPAIAFTSWWNLATGAWSLEPRSPVCEEAGHCQLVVPDPLEDSGEHALFA